MGAILRLPPLRKNASSDERKRLSDAFYSLLQQAIPERNVQFISWQITDAYFQGLRAFQSVDYKTGEVVISWEDEEGDLHLRWEEALTKFETEVGRLCRLDVSPQARKLTHSLDSLRNSSISQVILDNICRRSFEDLFKIQLMTGICMYGTYGQASWEDSDSDSPLSQIRELIPPWELLPVPAVYMNPTDLRGIIRTRLFPLAELERLGYDLPDSETDLDILEVPYGADLSTTSASGGAAGSHRDLYDKGGARPESIPQTRGARYKPERDTEKFTRLSELRTLAPGGATARYVAMAGHWILESKDFETEGRRVPLPIGIARYQDIGHFYGRSFASKIIPFALELEALLERIIQSSADLNRFGFLMVPNSLGIDMEMFKDTSGEPRLIPYEVDLAMPNLGVSHIAPPNASDVSGRVMNFGVTLMDRLCAQGPLYSGEAPGRADSSVAYSALAETGSTNLLPVAIRIEDSYTAVYRAMLHNVARRAERLPDALSRGLELARIENTIAGVTINPVTGRMELDPASLPDPWSCDLGIRSRDPVSGDRRRTEAYQLMASGALSPLEFIIMNYKEGWDYPIGNKAVWENYVKAVLINLIMFGDGQTPGKLPEYLVDGRPVGAYFSEIADKPEVHLMAIEDFIAPTEFALASPVIQNAFYERVNALRSRMGQRGLPPQVPTIEQAAVEAVAQQQAAVPSRRRTQPVETAASV